MPSEIVKTCSKLIAKKGYKISFIESATAGRMCSEFSLCEESGKILRGGISCYEVFVKERILSVPDELIKKFTPESAEVTKALACKGAEFFMTDITVAVTGLTTSGGSETAKKPVGTMFLHIIVGGRSISHREIFLGKAEAIILKTIDKAAQLIIKTI